MGQIFRYCSTLRESNSTSNSEHKCEIQGYGGYSSSQESTDDRSSFAIYAKSKSAIISKRLSRKLKSHTTLKQSQLL
jgi:hypothetical protein